MAKPCLWQIRYFSMAKQIAVETGIKIKLVKKLYQSWAGWLCYSDGAEGVALFALVLHWLPWGLDDCSCLKLCVDFILRLSDESCPIEKPQITAKKKRAKSLISLIYPSSYPSWYPLLQIHDFFACLNQSFRLLFVTINSYRIWNCLTFCE